MTNRFGAFDDYGVYHLFEHLYPLRDSEARRRQLYRLVCTSFMRQKQRCTQSHQAFVQDLTLVLEVAASEEPPNLAQQLRCCLVTAVLGSAATTAPPELLGILAGIGEFQRAMGYATLGQDGRGRCRAYLAVAEAQLGRGKPVESVATLERALAATKGAWRQPALDEYRRLEAVGWSRGEDADTFADVWGQDLEREWTLNDARAEIAQGLARAGALDRALEVIDHVDGAHAREDALGAVAKALVRQGDLDQAWRVGELLDGEWEKAGVLVEVVRFLLREVGPDPALEVAARIEPGWHRDVALAEVVNRLIAAGALERALPISEDIGETRFQAYARIGVAQALVQDGASGQAWQMVGPIYRSSSDPWVLSRLVPLLVDMKDYDEATWTAVGAIQALTNVWGWPDQAEALQEIAGALAHLWVAAGPGTVFGVMEHLGDERERVYTLIRLARSLVEVGRRRRAVALIREGLERAQKIRLQDTRILVFTDPDPVLRNLRETLLREAAFAAARIMGPDQAIELIEGVEDPDWRSFALTALAIALAERGFPWTAARLADRVLQAAESVCQTHERDDALHAIAVTLARANRAKQAQAVIAAIGSERKQDRARKSVEEAEEVHFERVPPAASDDGPSIQPEDLKEARAGARQAFAAMSKDISDYGEYDMPASMAREARNKVLIQAACKMARLGDRDGAMEAVSVLERAPFQAEAQRAVAEALAKGGWTGLALETARAITDEGQRAYALRDMAQALDQEGNVAEALRVWQIALQEARWVGCGQVFQVLGSGASLLARLDEGQTLWAVYEAVMEIEGWWDLP
jgi:tetratricopeptide (TPR) repeat protein